MIMFSYDEIRNKIINESCNNLLLGSGFSMAFNRNLSLNENEYLKQNLSDVEKDERNRQRNDSIKKETNLNACVVGHNVQINTRRTIVFVNTTLEIRI